MPPGTTHCSVRQRRAERTAVVGPQERRVGDTRIRVLPNPSGLNAHYTPAALGEAFAALYRAVEKPELP